MDKVSAGSMQPCDLITPMHITNSQGSYINSRPPTTIKINGLVPLKITNYNKQDESI
jgi:hypothetical protein